MGHRAIRAAGILSVTKRANRFSRIVFLLPLPGQDCAWFPGGELPENDRVNALPRNILRQSAKNSLAKSRRVWILMYSDRQWKVDGGQWQVGMGKLAGDSSALPEPVSGSPRRKKRK